jgi:hypothetical protein
MPSTTTSLAGTSDREDVANLAPIKDRALKPGAATDLWKNSGLPPGSC